MDIKITFNHNEIVKLIQDEILRQGLTATDLRFEVSGGNQFDPVLITAHATISPKPAKPAPVYRSNDDFRAPIGGTRP